jgi:hypothetical protein
MLRPSPGLQGKSYPCPPAWPEYAKGMLEMRRLDRLTPAHIAILIALGALLIWLFSRYQG